MPKPNRGSGRICHLTSVHSPFDVRIFHKECRTLAASGYEVFLIAPHDQEEVNDGVHILPVPRPNRRWQRMTRTVREIYRRAVQLDADIYHFHDPELIPVALLLRARGKQVVYDVHEDYPLQQLSKRWVPLPLRKSLSKVTAFVEKMTAYFVDGIVAATPAIGRKFPLRKTSVVQNFPILEGKNGATLPYSERENRVVYLGGITVQRGAYAMIKALEYLPADLAVRLSMAGSFNPPSLQMELQGMSGWSQVEYWGWLSRGEIIHLLGQSRVGLVVLHPLANYLESYPVKLFEYMAAGIPVIASDFPLWRQIVQEAGCGLLVDPLDPREIAQGIHWVLTHSEEAEAMGRRGQQAVKERYNWGVEATKLLAFYQKMEAVRS